MKNKKTDILYIVIFMGLLLSLIVFMPFSSFDAKTEKRNAAEFPKAVSENGALNLDFFDELTDYMNDNFAFRKQLATADALVKAKVFASSGSEKAVVGKNGWLYYTGSMDDYLGRDLMDKREINAAAKVLSLMQENSEAQGRKFLFVCAPNKNSLYPDNMPARYLQNRYPSNYDNLRIALSENKVNTVSLHDAFLADERIMYFEHDSHWDNEGAAFAVDKILGALDKPHYDYSDEPCTLEAVHRGDIMDLIYPSWKKMDEDHIYEKEHEYTYVNPVESVEDILIITQTPGRDNALLMFRDSYGNASIPYIADEYGKALFSKGVPYNMSLGASVSADTVIVEIVERNIAWLMEYVPFMEAPERSYGGEVQEAVSDLSSINMEDKGADMVFYGTLDPEYADDHAEVYISVKTPDGNTKYYAAFPSSYTEVENADEAKYSYGAYINKAALPAGSEVSVLSRKGSGLYKLSFLTL